jgi:hypothetical protein
MTELILFSAAWFAIGIVLGVNAATPSKEEPFDLTSSTVTDTPKTYFLGDW